MAHFATFDSLAVALLACAFWLAVRSGQRRALILDAALASTAAVMVMVKYASLPFVLPVLAVVAVVAVPAVGWRWAVARGLVTAGLVAAFIAGCVLLSGPDLMKGVTSTTLARSSDQVAASVILRHSVAYIGGIVTVAAIGMIALSVKGDGAMRGTFAQRTVLGFVLIGAALIAPVASLRLHTLTSLEKHAGYGLIFATPVVGFLLARIGVRSFLRNGVAVAVAGSLGFVGFAKARRFFTEWPDSTALVQALSPLVTSPATRILAEENSVPRYYLAGSIRQSQWSDTYYLAYTPAAAEAGSPGCRPTARP